MDLEKISIGGFEVIFTLKELVGRGAFGSVYLAEAQNWNSHRTTAEFAIKQMDKKIENEEQLVCEKAKVQHQLERILQFSHPNLISYHAWYFRSGTIRNSWTLGVVMEYCSGGNFQRHLEAVKCIPTKLVIKYCKQLLLAIDYLRKQKVAHTDLKPGNIMFVDKSQQVIKICDLDDPIILNQTVTKSGDIKEFRGTMRYFSPEMAAKYSLSPDKKTDVGRKTDIWSLGCIVLDMYDYSPVTRFKIAQGHPPAPDLYVSADTDFNTVVQYISSGGAPHISEEVPYWMKDFIRKCLEFHPAKRSTAEQLLLTRFLNPILPKNPPNLPEFNTQPVAAEDLARFECSKCQVSQSDTSGLLYLEIGEKAKPEDIQALCHRINSLDAKKPISVKLLLSSVDKIDLSAITKQIVIANFYLEFNCDLKKLEHLSLPNLLQMTFHYCNDIVIYKEDLRNFPSLLAVIFEHSTVFYLEENVFEEIKNLQYIGWNLGWEYEKIIHLYEKSHFQRFQFSAEYQWLRDYFKSHDGLLQPRMAGELWSFGESKSAEYKEPFSNYPEHQWAYLIQNQENLPKFEFHEFSEEDEILVRTSGFSDLLKCPIRNDDEISDEMFHIIWKEDSSPEQLLKVSQFAASMDKGHPIKMTVLGCHETDNVDFADVLSPISDWLCVLVIKRWDRFDGSRLATAYLPNLLELHFVSCENVSLKCGDLDGLPKLRSFIMQESTLRELGDSKENIFGGLSSLQFIMLFDVHARSYEQQLYWTRLKESAEFQWLRDYIQANPLLAEKKGTGEIWAFDTEGYCFLSEEHHAWNNPLVKEIEPYNDQDILTQLPRFRLDSLSEKDVAKLNVSGVECLIVKGPALFVSISTEATTDNVLQVFKKFYRMNMDTPVVVQIFNSEILKSRIFGAEINRKVIVLTLKNLKNYSTVQLTRLNLPNLIHIEFVRCENLEISAASFADFPKLRAITFKTTTLGTVDHSGFKRLPNLQVLQLDGDWRERLIGRQMGLLETAHLRRIHFSSEFQWLRDWVEKHAELFTNKDRGMVYIFGFLWNEPFLQEDNFLSSENLAYLTDI